MIINSKKLNAFEKDLKRRSRVGIRKAFQIMDDLYEEAKILRRGRRKNPLQGIEVVIKVAKAVNRV